MPKFQMTVYPDVVDVPDKLFKDVSSRLVHPNGIGSMEWTSGSLRRYADRTKKAPVIVTFDGDRPVSWMLLDLTDRVEMFTQKEYRNRGIASRMLVKMFQHTKKQVGVYWGNTFADHTYYKAVRIIERYNRLRNRFTQPLTE